MVFRKGLRKEIDEHSRISYHLINFQILTLAQFTSMLVVKKKDENFRKLAHGQTSQIIGTRDFMGLSHGALSLFKGKVTRPRFL